MTKKPIFITLSVTQEEIDQIDSMKRSYTKTEE